MIATQTIEGTWSVRYSYDQALADGVAVHLYGSGDTAMLVCENHGQGPCEHINTVLEMRDESEPRDGASAFLSSLCRRLVRRS